MGTEASTSAKPVRRGKSLPYTLLFCAICILLNFLGSLITTSLNSPIFLDCTGTILAGAIGGYIPGVAVGYITNLFTSFSDPSSVYYCLLNVLIGLLAAYCGRRHWFDKLQTILPAIIGFALIGGGLGSIITWCLYGVFGGGVSTPFALQVGAALGVGGFAPEFIADLLIDVLDKGFTVLIAVMVIHTIPHELKCKIGFDIWQQTPLTDKQMHAVKHAKTRSFPLRAKIVALVAVVMVIIAIATTSISYIMFHRSGIDTQGRVGVGIANLAAEHIDPDRVDDYIEHGSSAPGYLETEKALAQIRDSLPNAERISVYQIREDGCHVVFDPDLPDKPGDKPGTVIPIDKAFEPYLDQLLAGEAIDPVDSGATSNWTLATYLPVYDSSGNCACYVAVDLSLERLAQDEFAFIARVVILFSGFFALICAIVIWLAEYGIILPLKSISLVSSKFAFTNRAERVESMDHMRELDIHTGDEIEKLYQAITQTSHDTMRYIADSAEKAATIERMQDNLIMVMADLVESRDEHTGDHVRKTAAYTRAIMEQMRRDGIYADEITDEFIDNVAKSAPLHDVGKIEVSDIILNKPGRLTDDEFKVMQQHTLAGQHILEDAVDAISDPGYLEEAQRLATYHHEKWNGEGYPFGLAGEEIPLSARIMAVADVFDALVSKRSYKDGMSVDMAVEIIEKNAGEHFDPQVVDAFLHAEDEIRRIAEAHGDAHGNANDIRNEDDGPAEPDEAGNPDEGAELVE